MNEETHRTVTITAEMHTSYSIEVNVPSYLDDDDIWQKLVRDGHLNGSNMVCDNDGWADYWTWGDMYDSDFNPVADDYSDSFPEITDCWEDHNDSYPPPWERPVIEALIDGIIKRGFSIEIRCGTRRMYGPGIDKREIFAELAAGDEDVIALHKDGKHSGVFHLIYNNGSKKDPRVVIHDYSCHDWCEEIMKELPK